ncbi:hypothetical protein Ltuc_2490 [Legionella tucsonensis]|uniref:Uncharacterized protein n=1 Tax=Legionella tucsonensis TaxID=40335 RepID=A0A0W0ZRL0_9GAMM|nr:hypothetical protein Ltuc_2490 [Legionella tucsonensis]
MPTPLGELLYSAQKSKNAEKLRILRRGGYAAHFFQSKNQNLNPSQANKIIDIYSARHFMPTYDNVAMEVKKGNNPRYP